MVRNVSYILTIDIPVQLLGCDDYWSWGMYDMPRLVGVKLMVKNVDPNETGNPWNSY